MSGREEEELKQQVKIKEAIKKLDAS